MEKKAKMKTIMVSESPAACKAIFEKAQTFIVKKTYGKDVGTVVLYATLPDSKVAGQATVEGPCFRACSTPAETAKAWREIKGTCGLEKAEFERICKGRETVGVYKIVSAKKFSKAKTIEDFGVKRIPQQFVYVE